MKQIKLMVLLALLCIVTSMGNVYALSSISILGETAVSQKITGEDEYLSYLSDGTMTSGVYEVDSLILMRSFVEFNFDAWYNTGLSLSNIESITLKLPSVGSDSPSIDLYEVSSNALLSALSAAEIFELVTPLSMTPVNNAPVPPTTGDGNGYEEQVIENDEMGTVIGMQLDVTSYLLDNISNGSVGASWAGFGLVCSNELVDSDGVAAFLNPYLKIAYSTNTNSAVVPEPGTCALLGLGLLGYLGLRKKFSK
jgi:hypothetical protein